MLLRPAHYAFLTVAALAGSFACAHSNATPSARAVAARGQPGTAASATCSVSARPQAKDVCSAAVCTAGKWQLQPVGPRVVCELSDDYSERQAVALEAFRGDPGVCSRGECVPRMLCAERCGTTLGAELGAPLYARLQECRSLPNRTAQSCADDLKRNDGEMREFGFRLLDCLHDCGFELPRFSDKLVPLPLPVERGDEIPSN